MKQAWKKVTSKKKWIIWKKMTHEKSHRKKWIMEISVMWGKKKYMKSCENTNESWGKEITQKMTCVEINESCEKQKEWK